MNTPNPDDSGKQSQAQGIGAEVPHPEPAKPPRSLNAGKHFLRAENILTPAENPTDYLNHLNSYLLMFKPQFDFQYRLALRMGQNDWRLGRAARFEKEILEKASYVEEVVKLQSTLALYETRLEGNNNRCLTQLNKSFGWLKNWQALTGESGEAPVDLLTSLAPEGNPYDLDVLKDIPVNPAEGYAWRAKQTDLALSRQSTPVTPAQVDHLQALQEQALCLEKQPAKPDARIPNPILAYLEPRLLAQQPQLGLGDHQALFNAVGLDFDNPPPL